MTSLGFPNYCSCYIGSPKGSTRIVNVPRNQRHTSTMILEKWDPETHWLMQNPPNYKTKPSQLEASGLSESTFGPGFKGNIWNKTKNAKKLPQSPLGFLDPRLVFTLTMAQGKYWGFQSECSIWWHLASTRQTPGLRILWKLFRYSNIFKEQSLIYLTQLNRTLSGGLKKEVGKKSVSLYIGIYICLTIRLTYTPQIISLFQRGAL